VKHKCRNAYCPNKYDDVIGKVGWTQHATLKGAECIPCLYAGQMVSQGQTIEQVEAVPQLMQMFLDLLVKTGWTWQDVKDAYQRASTNQPKSTRGWMGARSQFDTED
jgi:hypothetical protein